MYETVWEKNILAGGKQKKLSVRRGDFSELTEPVDVFVCSAYKRKYGIYPGTIFEILSNKMKISVEEEAQKAKLDYRETEDFWISNELECSIKGIACIELLDISCRNNSDEGKLKFLCEGFLKLYELLVKMDEQGLCVEKVVLPVLGSGNQGLEACYIVPALVEQSLRALNDITQLKEIIFFEKNEEKAAELVKSLNNLEKKTDREPDVFISYCSAQRKLADELRKMMQKQGVKCWMAPYSIPAGSSYQEEIPAALSKSTIVLLVLSREAEQSRWVQKEVGCTIGMRHTLVPYQSEPYEHSAKFNFLLDGEQIFEADQSLSEREKATEVVEYLQKKLGLPKKPIHAKSTESTKPTENAGSTETAAPTGHAAPKEQSGKRKKRNCKPTDLVLAGIGLILAVELGFVVKYLKKLTKD